MHKDRSCPPTCGRADVYTVAQLLLIMPFSLSPSPPLSLVRPSVRPSHPPPLVPPSLPSPPSHLHPSHLHPSQPKASLRRSSPADGRTNYAHTCRLSDRKKTGGFVLSRGAPPLASASAPASASASAASAPRTRAAPRRLRTASATVVAAAVFASCCSRAPLQAEAFFLQPTTAGRAHRYCMRVGRFLRMRAIPPEWERRG